MLLPTVSGVSGSSALDALSSVSQVTSSSSTANSSSSGAVAGDSTKVSGFAQMLSKLDDLEKNDPAQAKQMLENIASKLQSAAAETTGDQADRLNALAQKFTTAASTGDLSGLQPQQQAQGAQTGGHHHHHHGHAAYAQQQSQSQDDSTTDALMAAVSS